jgi:hypothetical protein
MSAGWVLVQTQDGVASDVVSALADLPGVESADRTAGAYDVVARVADAGPAVRSAKRVAQAALRLPGVTVAVCCHQGGPESIDLTNRPEQVDLTTTDRTQSDGSRRSGGLATL